MTILVSACLLGIDCKYSGGNNCNSRVVKYLEGKQWIPICPEQLGGLTTPRTPAEIDLGDGNLVLEGKARVMTKDGRDVTQAFIKGAEESLKLAQLSEADTAILKARSPSCGHGQIYDGSFQRQPKPGSGVTAALLQKHGLKLLTEVDL